MNFNPNLYISYHTLSPLSDTKRCLEVEDVLGNSSGLVQDIEIEKIRIGMRVQAVWKPKEEWTHSLENIRWFAPTDEPDVDISTLRFQPS